jgi:hypothetical protein
MLEKKHTIQKALVLLSLAVIVLIRLHRSTVADPDLWGYMTFGRLFWDSGTFPYQDIFTYLPTFDHWIYHEWLTGVGLYPIYKLTGGFGLVVLRDLVALATLGFLYLAARYRQSSPASAVFSILVVSQFLIVGYATVLRAQIFTYLFVALTLYLLERARQKGQWPFLLVLVPVQIVWCNLHGGFLTGLGIIAIYTAGEAFSHRTWLPYLLVLLLSVFSTLINPYGIDYWTYLFRAVTMPRGDITEWSSIYTAYLIHSISLGQIIWYASMAILPLMILIRVRWHEITPILLLSVTFILGLQHVRHQVFFPMLVAVYLPKPLQSYIELLQIPLANILKLLKEKAPAFIVGPRRVATFFIAILTLFFFLFLDLPSFSFMVPSREKKEIADYPTGAQLEYIKRNYSSGNILTEFEWGEYLIWNLGPRIKVGLDGRYETIYQDHVANEYFDYIKGKKNSFLDAYAHDIVLFRPDSPAVVFLRHSPDWKVAYEDMDSILFAKVRR